MAVRVIDALSAEDRITAKDEDDPEQYTRVYWMTIEAFPQFQDETHPNWNAHSFFNEDAVPLVRTQDLTVTEDNQHAPAKKRVGRNLDGDFYRYFQVPMGQSGRATYLSTSASASEEEVFTCAVQNGEEKCGHEIKILAGEL